MYNSIPNVDINNNLFHIGDKVIQLPIGSYELNDIYDFLKNKLKDYDLEKTFQMESNNNTFKFILQLPRNLFILLETTPLDNCLVSIKK